jgi:uncharacterized protein DUF4154
MGAALTPVMKIFRHSGTWLRAERRCAWAQAAWLFAALACSASLLFAETKPSQYQIEATYLYNFSRFVSWPAQAAAAKTGSFGICVLGDDPFGKSLDSILSGENVGGKTLVARRISKPQDASDCHILFVSLSEEPRLTNIIQTLDSESVLTVSDIPEFSERGGMIQFVMAGDRVRFEVNLKKASDAGLTLSADLLKVAVSVHRDAQPGA